MDNNTIDKLVAESLVNRLAEGELNRAHLEARYTLALTELQAFKAVLESVSYTHLTLPTILRV